MKIKEDIKRTINIIWYIAKVYIKSIFAFWGVMFLVALKAHRNPFVEFQKYSGAAHRKQRKRSMGELLFCMLRASGNR